MKLLRKLRALFQKTRLDREMAEEMRAHVAFQTQANLNAGMPPEDARYAALRQFGGVERIKEQVRDQRGWAWLGNLVQDLRYAVRQSFKTPGFTAVAVLSLGLGIGACTGVYSVIDGVLLHPVGIDPHTEREIRLYETQLPNVPNSRVSVPNFLDWEKQAKSFVFMRAGAGANLTLTGEGEPIHLAGAKSTHNLLGTHTWTLALGRGFLPEDDVKGTDHSIVISYQIWQQMFGGDPRAIGRSLQVNGGPYTLVGVISEEVGRFSQADAFISMGFTEQERAQRGTHSLDVWGRLKPGVTLAQAQAEMNVLAAQLAQQHPDTNKGWGISLVPVNQMQGAAGLRQAMWALLGAVGCVLLIACANVANLLLARATARQREMAIRAAMGAGRTRLIRQLLTESMLLALMGGAAGVLLAHWGLQLVHGYAGSGMERLGYVELNPGMLVSAVGLSLATGLVFGLAPAWFAARVNLNGVLKQGSRGSTEGGSRNRLRGALVVVEVALALVLLAGSSALIRRLVERARLDPGFASKGVTILQLNLPREKYPGSPQVAAFVDAVCARLQNLSGVRSAGVTTALPTVQRMFGFDIDRRAVRPRAAWPTASTFSVTPDYFATMGIRLLRGRIFSPLDAAAAPRVALVNEALAKEYFPGEDPLGRRINLANGPDAWREIVGIVNDVTQFGDETTVTPQVYEPFAQNPGLGLSFAVRAAGDPAAIYSSLKPQVYAVDKDQPVLVMRPLQDLLDARVTGQRFTMHLLAVFSLIALVIAAVGIYAVVAYTVSQRTGEIGIRMALGAQSRDVLRLVLVFGARMVGLGLAAGIGAAFVAGRTVERMLYQVNDRDPLTLTAVTLLLASVAFLACLVPARRAAKIDPMVALRTE